MGLCNIRLVFNLRRSILDSQMMEDCHNLQACAFAWCAKVVLLGNTFALARNVDNQIEVDPNLAKLLQ